MRRAMLSFRDGARIIAGFALDDIAEHHIVGSVNLRFIYIGMIAETARHAGHVDIVAEQKR